MRTHWAVKYIGMPHKSGGRTEAGVDCWGLVRMVYEKEFHIQLPELPGITEQAVAIIAGQIQISIRKDWEEVEKPFDGAVVAMSQHQAIHHVGLYAAVDGGKIVHCWDYQNVIADTVRGVAFKGFQTVKFYRHKLWLTLSNSPTLSTRRPHVNIGRPPGSLFVGGSKSSIPDSSSLPFPPSAS